jgi:hypothetical protein
MRQCTRGVSEMPSCFPHQSAASSLRASCDIKERPHKIPRRAWPARFSISLPPQIEGRAGGRKAGRFSIVGGPGAARARRYFGSPPLRLSLAWHHARAWTGTTSGPGPSIPGGAAACPLSAGALLPPRGWIRLLRSTERQSLHPCPRGFLRRRFLPTVQGGLARTRVPRGRNGASVGAA